VLDNKLPRAVIYLEPHQVSLYSTLTSTISNVVFSEGVIRDMEVVAVDVLQSQLETWLKQQNTQPHVAVLVLAEQTYFKKEFPGKQNAPSSAEITAFLDLVPLESPTTRVIPMVGAAVAVAANKDFYQPVVEVLQKEKISVVALTPTFVFKTDQAQAWQFNPETARKIVSEWETAQKFSLVGMITKRAAPKPSDNGNSSSAVALASARFGPTEEESKILGLPRVAFLGIAFAILLGVLGVMIYFQFTSTS
jgi:hypothetical protein